MAEKSLLSGIPAENIERLVRVEHTDPHSILGGHAYTVRNKKGSVVRAFHPEAVKAEVLIQGKEPSLMTKCHPGGLFAAFITNSSPSVTEFVSFLLMETTGKAMILTSSCRPWGIWTCTWQEKGPIIAFMKGSELTCIR